MSSAQKDTIYIDIDDEITSIIDKVNAADNKIVALVLPKRAAMLQSIVNMKLLKRTAESSKKKVVLITSEAGLLPLAGAVGLHVAKTPNSKPEIPSPPKAADDKPVNVAEAEPDAGDEEELDKTQPIGRLAGLPAEKEADDTIEVAAPEEPPEPAAKAGKKSKKPKVPNFNKFRLRLILGVLALVLLVVGWYVANYVLPSAVIAIQTDTTSISSDMNLTVRPGLDEFDAEQSLVPGIQKELSKTDTEKVAATGQKDVGKKASGEVTLYANISPFPPTVESGTGVSTNNLTFITAQKADFSPQNTGDGLKWVATVPVNAQNGGEQYNIGAGASFSVAGQPGITGENASSMSGGTSRIIKVVRQEDVNNARDRLLERNNDAAKEELTTQLKDEGYLAIADSFKAGKPELSTSPNVGDEATEVTVTSTIVFTMTGAERDPLSQLVTDNVKDQIDGEKQSVLSDGLDEATIRILSRESNGDIRLSVQTLVTAGAQQDEAAIKREIMGKKKGETEQIIKARPGVRGVNIDYSPFWVFSTPTKEGKITITFESTTTDANSE